MIFFVTLKVALRSLWANKLRSFLAILGIIIGVAAVISMLSLGAGARKNVVDNISKMGTELIVVRPGNKGFRGVSSGRRNMKVDDAKAIIQKVKGIKCISPVVGANAQLKYLNKNTRANIQGVAETYFEIRNFEIGDGRIFTEQEVERGLRVTVIGKQIVDTLFDEDVDPVGMTVKLKGQNFKIVGTLKEKGDQGWFNMDEVVLVPFTTAMKHLTGDDHLREINVMAEKNYDLTKLEKDITDLLRKQHNIKDGEPEDFHVRNQSELLDTFSSITQTFTILLGGIASISLLVGGIGIMNIMLVTVTERTKEIGIRKAIGAQNKDILRQFLIESILISGIGGILGILGGVAIGYIIEHFTSFSTVIEMYGVVLAVLFSTGVGVFFGYYPARRAAMMEPCAALRYE